MCHNKVLANPCDEVVFKYPLDQLMEDIRGKESMNVGLWEIVGEWLFIQTQVISKQRDAVIKCDEKKGKGKKESKEYTYDDVTDKAILIP
jgi:hypothetical protein